MNWQPIHKVRAAGAIRANLDNYEHACASFSWDTVRDELSVPAKFNIAGAIDRHADGLRRDHLAIRWLGENGATRDFSYGEIRAQTNRFANVLRTLGAGKGDRVFVCAPRVPELYIAALATLKNTSVFCPIFPAFGPEPVFQRLSRGNAKVLVTTTALYKQKIDNLLSRLPQLQSVLLADAEEDLNERCRSLPRLMKAASSEFTIPPTDPEEMALLHFTSGTTGMPKGAIHVHNAALMHYVTGKFVLDFHPDDIFWCTADPGWVTGTSYGIIAPLLHGVTNIVDEAEFDAERWYRILQDQKVTVWYTAPTAIRRLMRLSIAPRENFDLGALRLIHSVGEPLNPEERTANSSQVGRGAGVSPNVDIAGRLDEVANIFAEQGANRFRVQAYRRAANVLRRLSRSVADVFAEEGIEGLEQIRGIGRSIARAIRDILLHGRLAMLDRLRGESRAIAILATVPGIGKVYVWRLHDDLGIETLEELEIAAHDGRLEHHPGIGAKRLAGIRDSLAQRLGRIRRQAVPVPTTPAPSEPPRAPQKPSISELLDVDREYWNKANAGVLKKIAPRRFNPGGEAWLPIMHTARNGRHYTALFSNTARAHELGKTRDWVVLFCDNGDMEHRFTVITSEFGPLQGKRIVAGREAECEKYYKRVSNQ